MCCVRFFGIIPIGKYLLFPFGSVFVLGILGVLWINIANAELQINEAVSCWKNKKVAKSYEEIVCQKYLEAIPNMYARVGVFFNLSHETFLAYCEQILDNAITLLLNWP